MQPSRTRLICRAHNRFNPSIALWQHFVASVSSTIQQQRLSSTEHEAPSTGENGTRVTHDARDVKGPAQSQAEDGGNIEQDKQFKVTLRKMTTVKGRFVKAEALAVRNRQKPHASQPALPTESAKLLAVAMAAFEAAEDYEAVAVKPKVNPTPVKESALPWCLPEEERTMNGMDRLALEIERFHAYARPSRFENIARKHLIEQVRTHVREALPDHVLEVFGSERTGIAFATSDVDFRLTKHSRLSDQKTSKLPPARAERDQALKDLRTLYWTQLRNHKAYILPAIRYARYPLISMQDKRSGLDVQIVLSNDTSVSRMTMQEYMEEYPYLCQLYFVVKSMFDVRGLSDVFRGGFGSYSLFMMIVASMRHDPHPRKDAAGGLLKFLRFWRDFDTRTMGISIDPPFLFNKESGTITSPKVKSKLEQGILKPLPAYMLSLRDPADETNDLGRKGVAIKHVQETFRVLLERLEHDIKVNTRPSLLGPLVGPSYMLYYAQRQKFNNYGKLVLSQVQSQLVAKAQEIREAELVEDPETVKKEIEEEQEKQRLAKEERDREWRRLAEERNARLRLEAQRTPDLQHGEAIASSLGVPAVEDERDLVKTSGR